MLKTSPVVGFKVKFLRDKFYPAKDENQKDKYRLTFAAAERARKKSSAKGNGLTIPIEEMEKLGGNIGISLNPSEYQKWAAKLEPGQIYLIEVTVGTFTLPGASESMIFYDELLSVEKWAGSSSPIVRVLDKFADEVEDSDF